MRDSNGRFIKGTGEGFKKGHPPYNHKLKEWREGGGIPWNKGLTYTQKVRPTRERCLKISEKLKGNKNTLGYRHTEQEKKLRSERNTKEKHPQWIKDRSTIDITKRNSVEYYHLVKKVRKRDKNSCRLKTTECSGRNAVHHIFRWAEYPELRYIINNCITLCEFHHPRKKVDERRLIPVLKRLVGSCEQYYFKRKPII